MTNRLIVVLLGFCALPVLQGAEVLRYRPQPNSQVVYQVRITADTPSSVDTMTGYVVYDVVSSTETVKLKYRGGLNRTSKQKSSSSRSDAGPFGGSPFGPRFLAPPMIANPFERRVNPLQGLEQAANEVTISPTGEILALTGTSQLPFLLGNLSTLFFEPLPETERPSWKVEGGLMLTEKGEQRSRDRFDPFAGNEANKPEKRIAASESISMTFKSSQNGIRIYDREYKLTAPADGLSLSVDGGGQWTFNFQLGISESLDVKQSLRLKLENIEFTIPMTVKYERVAPDVWAKLERDRLAQEDSLRAMAEQRSAEEKAAAEAPLTAAERNTFIANLQSGQAAEISEVLQKLSKKTARDDAELAQAIEPLLQHADAKIQSQVKQALANVSPKYKRVYDLNRAYQRSFPVAEFGLWVSHDTPLPLGLIVAANSFHSEETQYFPATVVQPLDNGLVRVKYHDRGSFTEERLREDMFLAPPEVEQPNISPEQLAAVRAYEAKIRQSVSGSPELERLIRSYRDGNQPVPKVGDPIPPGATLPKFLVVAAKKNNQWFQAHISKELPDGRVALRFSGERIDATVPRSDIRLPPREVVAPNLLPPFASSGGESESSPASADTMFRTWSDSSGTFTIEAKFAGTVAEGVRLIRRDNKQIVVPFSRLSEADRQYVQGLSKPTNPFEP